MADADICRDWSCELPSKYNKYSRLQLPFEGDQDYNNCSYPQYSYTSMQYFPSNCHRHMACSVTQETPREATRQEQNDSYTYSEASPYLSPESPTESCNGKTYRDPLSCLSDLSPESVASNFHLKKSVVYGSYYQCQVESGLQNPTRYHVRETQRNQVKEYLSQSHDGSKYVIRQMLAPQSSAPAGGGDGFHGSTPASPLARLNISSSADNLGDNMNEIIDDIVSFESSYGDEHALRYERPTAASIPTVSPSDMERFTQTTIKKLPVTIQENTSSSCPVIKREFTEEDIRLFNKDRIKKDNHNIIERRRRYNINDRIKELGQLVPKSLDPDMRWNKGSILKAAVDYIHTLQGEQSRFQQVQQKAKEMATLNKKLILRVQELELALQQHGITVGTDPADTQLTMNTLLHYETPTTTSNQSVLSKEEERHVSTFPSNPISPPSGSPIVMVTQPQSNNQQEMIIMQAEPSNTPDAGVAYQMSPQNYQTHQLMTIADPRTLSPHQHQSQQQIQHQQHTQQQTNTSFNQHAYSPLGSVSSNPSPHQVTNPQPSQPSINLDIEGLDMDMSAFTYENPGNTDLTNMVDGGFSALLAGTTNSEFNDVMMDDYSMIKDDIFLSDANRNNSNIQ